uniref:E3 ubiquitin-protein ligase E3D n=1 Tax=Lygus hesperus TaxID=30085 RepID=A0A0A9WC56_LYGHE
MATTVYVEVRPNVRACNFCIKTSSEVESSSAKIGASEIEVRLPTIIGTLRVELPTNIILLPGSMSGYSCSEDIISFRAQIATYNSSALADLGPSSYSPGVKKNEKVSLICCICQEHLSGDLSFSRILPLPSTEELNDFFCHRHSNEKISLDPCASDLFYNFFFFKMNIETLNITDGIHQFKCHRCSTIHGEINEKCVKLWNSTVRWSSEHNQECILERFLRSVKYFIKDLPIQMNKFVFTCSQGHHPTRYTLVWILDRSLVLLTGTHQSSCESVKMDSGNVMKVLYRHYTEINNEVNEWLDSFTTSVVPIPPRVEIDLLGYFKKMSERIPSDSNNVNGMNISYLQI